MQSRTGSADVETMSGELKIVARDAKRLRGATVSGEIDVEASFLPSVEAEFTLNEKLANPNRYWPDDRYYLARIAAIRGQDQLALVLMQRAVDGGWREHWRAVNDPAMVNIQSDRFFVTMMAGLENRPIMIRDQLRLEADFAMGS